MSGGGDERANDGEIFDVLDEMGNAVVGQASRIDCHKKGFFLLLLSVSLSHSLSGLYHQSVHVLIRDCTTGRVLLQKRADSKRIAPGLWDISCAEHLSVSETFQQAAIRGMQEELGLEQRQLFNVKQIRPKQLFRRQYSFTGESYIDNEFIACFEAEIDEPKCKIRIDPDEVSDIKWVTTNWIKSDLENNPHIYTPWFHDEKHLL